MSTTHDAQIGVAILGAANIARKTFAAVTAAGLEVVSLGCRDVARGEAFVSECLGCLRGSAGEGVSLPRRPRVVSYQDAVSDPKAQIVYIPLPVKVRHDWIVACSANGKHVVCEKPPAESLDQLAEWIRLLSEKKLFFMDGTMLSHGRRLAAIREALFSSKVVGTPRHLHNEFSFLCPETDIRHDPALEPMGALGDLGWYCVRYGQHLFGNPLRVVHARALRNDRGGIVELSATLEYEGGATHSMRCSFRSAILQWLVISGDVASIAMDDFVLPVVDPTNHTSYQVLKNDIRTVGCAVPHTRHVDVVSIEESSTFQEEQLWRDAAAMARSFDEKAARAWAELSFGTQRTLHLILDAIA